MALEQEFKTKVVIETCVACGMQFGMHVDFYNKMRTAGPDKSFYCPAGHLQKYLYKKGDELADQLKREKERVESLQRSVTGLRITVEQKDNTIRSMKSARTVLRKKLNLKK